VLKCHLRAYVLSSERAYVRSLKPVRQSYGHYSLIRQCGGNTFQRLMSRAPGHEINCRRMAIYFPIGTKYLKKGKEKRGKRKEKGEEKEREGKGGEKQKIRQKPVKMHHSHGLQGAL